MTATETNWTIHCARCGCVSSTVRRDHDNIARCAVCYREEFTPKEEEREWIEASSHPSYWRQP